MCYWVGVVALYRVPCGTEIFLRLVSDLALCVAHSVTNLSQQGSL